MHVCLKFCLLSVLCVVRADIVVITQKHNYSVDVFADLPASFGGFIPHHGLRGYLVAASPQNACSPIEPPPALKNYTGRWIALIRRYDCNFVDKVREAQNANYDAAIIYNVGSNAIGTIFNLIVGLLVNFRECFRADGWCRCRWHQHHSRVCRRRRRIDHIISLSIRKRIQDTDHWRAAVQHQQLPSALCHHRGHLFSGHAHLHGKLSSSTISCEFRLTFLLRLSSVWRIDVGCDVIDCLRLVWRRFPRPNSKKVIRTTRVPFALKTTSMVISFVFYLVPMVIFFSLFLLLSMRLDSTFFDLWCVILS